MAAPVVQGADIKSTVHVEARVEAKNDMSRCCPRKVFCCSKEVEERDQCIHRLSQSSMDALKEASEADKHRKHHRVKKG